MGVIRDLFGMLFGTNRNVIKETAEVFRENAEAGAQRAADHQSAALAQYAAEFTHPRKSWFDVLIDGLNRLPRPLLAFGTIGLFVSAMVNPVWFSSRMQGIALVPEPLWWLLGAIISFYFGARHQAKGQEFQKAIAGSLSRTETVMSNLKALDAMNWNSEVGAADTKGDAKLSLDAARPDRNAALDEWKASS